MVRFAHRDGPSLLKLWVCASVDHLAGMASRGEVSQDNADYFVDSEPYDGFVLGEPSPTFHWTNFGATTEAEGMEFADRYAYLEPTT